MRVCDDSILPCRPFDPALYEDEVEDESEILDEEGRARMKLKVSLTKSARQRYCQLVHPLSCLTVCLSLPLPLSLSLPLLLLVHVGGEYYSMEILSG